MTRALSQDEREKQNARRRRAWNKQADGYDKQIGWFERHVFGEDNRSWACRRAEGEVLEVAIGTGLNLGAYPPDVRLTGLDLSSAMLDIARRRGTELGRTIELKEGDAHRLPFDDESFDSVVCTFSLCNIPDLALALSEMKRVLRPGGRLILVDPIDNPPISRRVTGVAKRAEAVRPTSLPFGKDSMTWRVNMEPVIGLGGGRALLLQVLHPLVAAGVEQHSNFAQDPFRRGFRTADMMLKLAFADARVSERQADLLRRMHEKVQGVSADRVPYRAMDPQLLLWVWATLVDVSVLMFERAVRPLDPDERERYYEEQKLIAHACGVPVGCCPATYEDLVAYIQRVIGSELRVTQTARVVAFAGRHPPLPWPLGPLAGWLGTLFTAGLIPQRFRAELGYEWSPRNGRLLRVLLGVSRVLAKVVPRPVRHLPNRYLIRRKTPLGWWRNRPVNIPDELRSTG